MLPILPNTPPGSRVWPIVHFPLVLLVIAVVMLIGAGMASHVVLPDNRPGDHSGWAQAGVVAANAGICVLVYWAFVRFVERRRDVTDLAPRGAVRELAGGYAAGLVLFSVVLAVIALGGGYRIVGVNPASVLVLPLFAGLMTGLVEEILFRALFFRLMERLFGSWIALLASALLFGLAHLANPNATLLAGLAIALEAGVMLGALYTLTRRLWAVVGLHAAWNFAQGGIYGVAVSGSTQVGLLQPAIQGPVLLTGGAFGAEASLPAVTIDTLFGIAILVLAYRRDRFVAPAWRRARSAA